MQQIRSIGVSTSTVPTVNTWLLMIVNDSFQMAQVIRFLGHFQTIKLSGSIFFSENKWIKKSRIKNKPINSVHSSFCNRYQWGKLFNKSFFHKSTYRKVARSSMSQLVAHFQIFRRLMKWKFDAYVLWPLAKKFQNWIVDRSTARDFTVINVH